MKATVSTRRYERTRRLLDAARTMLTLWQYEAPKRWDEDKDLRTLMFAINQELNEKEPDDGSARSTL